MEEIKGENSEETKIITPKEEKQQEPQILKSSEEKLKEEPKPEEQKIVEQPKKKKIKEIFKKHKNIFRLVIIISVLILFYYAFISFRSGKLFYTSESEVSSYAFAIGSWNRPFLEGSVSDYKVFVYYTSNKGAFLAGEPIHADIKVEINNESLKNKTNKFVIVFPDAYNYTLLSIEGININNSISPGIVLDCIGSICRGSIKLIYFLPNDYSFKIVINNVPQMPLEEGNSFSLFYNENKTWQFFFSLPINYNYILDSKSKIHISPLEVKYQLAYNDWIFIISLIVGAFALIQILFEFLRD